jgi:hypothetical protein
MRKEAFLVLFLLIFLGGFVSAEERFDCKNLTNESEIMVFVESLYPDFGETVVIPSLEKDQLVLTIKSKSLDEPICVLSYSVKGLEDFSTLVTEEPGVKFTVQEEPVHQWIAYQSENIWSTSEISSYVPPSWSEGQLYLDSYEITYGSRMEDDEYSADYLDCFLTGHPYCNHFWDPDGGPDAGLNYVVQWDSNYRRAQTLWDTKVIPYYESGNKEDAYYWLGRVVHLLGDLGVPAHVHLDPHIGWPDHDTLEKYLADDTDNSAGNYRQWTSSGTATSAYDLYSLFYDMAEITDNYDSNDASGEFSNHYEGHNSACETQDGFWGCYDVSYAEARIHANAIMPELYKHVGGLYKLFWEETSDVGCPGACCDSYDHFKLNGEQPNSVSDSNVCISGDTYFKDYYCTGSSASYSYTNTFNEDCGEDYCEAWGDNYCASGNVYKI